MLLYNSGVFSRYNVSEDLLPEEYRLHGIDRQQRLNNLVVRLVPCTERQVYYQPIVDLASQLRGYKSPEARKFAESFSSILKLVKDDIHDTESFRRDLEAIEFEKRTVARSFVWKYNELLDR